MGVISIINVFQYLLRTIIKKISIYLSVLLHCNQDDFSISFYYYYYDFLVCLWRKYNLNETKN